MVGVSRRAGVLLLAALATAALLTSGCGAPPATLELIAVANKAMADAAQAAQERHAEDIQRLVGQAGALDAAFDADVRLVEAGKITGTDGKPIELSAEWVISARKGYAAARGALAEQRHRLDENHATSIDNLSAAAEALEMARELILQHYALTGRARQALKSMTRRLIGER